MNVIRLYQKHIIFVSVLIGIFLRFYTATFGSNYDFETWNIGANLIKDGISVYTIPDSDSWGRFNWGPIWPYTLYIFKVISGEDRLTFHLFLTGYLTIIDLLICFFLYKLFGKLISILYFLSPLTYLITGFALQFENTAILLALIGWYYYLKDSKKYYYLTAVLFGLSLSAKHLLILFPLWLFFYEFIKSKKFDLKVLLLNVFHKFLTYFIFISFFLFEIILHLQNSKDVIEGIVKYVIKYTHLMAYQLLDM